MEEIFRCIKVCQKTLIDEQQKDGGFISLSTSNPNDFSQSLHLQTTFATTIILAALCNKDISSNLSIEKVKKKAALFLLSQMGANYSFNYWSKTAPERKTLPYPDDLDDTFCALSALFLYDKAIISGQALAKIVRLLTYSEKKVGGPYKTWLVPKNATEWQDVDIAVNANIAYFLFLNDTSLSGLTNFILQNLTKQSLRSPYYPSMYPLLYFITRFHNNKNIKIEKLLLSNNQSNPLESALIAISFMRMGVKNQKVTTYIRDITKEVDSDLQPYAFCIDPARRGKTYYSGSKALTAALFLEALSMYAAEAKKESPKLEESKILHAIDKKFQTSIEKLDPEMKKGVSSIMQRVLKNDPNNQIRLLPYYFAQSLGKKGKKIPKKLIVELGCANLFGWIAYVIYDNFYDNEAQNYTLSVANSSLRRLTTLYSNLLPKSKLHKIFENYMDEIDEANLWEMQHCRFEVKDGYINLKNLTLPRYGNFEVLASRSIGHALSPLTILHYMGVKPNSNEFKQIDLFFRNYIIAKQLNDDAHDWEEDLKRGQISPVVVMLLKKVPSKRYRIDALIKQLKKIFWEEIIDSLCREIYAHCRKACTHLNKTTKITDKHYFEGLVKRYEAAAKTALLERDKTRSFLRNY